MAKNEAITITMIFMMPIPGFGHPDGRPSDAPIRPFSHSSRAMPPLHILDLSQSTTWRATTFLTKG
jgi:hypothetical protein